MLLNADGERFMRDRHRLAELAPRDVVARAIFREQAGRSEGLSRRATSSGSGFKKRFPGIYALCKARGIDPSRQLIPVTPAAHYMMGGVVVDLTGRSSLKRLYACGEVSRTGVHGANRLASNSLLEGLVFAERVARDLVQTPKLARGAAQAELARAAARRSRRGAGGGGRDSPRDVGIRRDCADRQRAQKVH